jgi:hypothetical protein
MILTASPNTIILVPVPRLLLVPVLFLGFRGLFVLPLHIHYIVQLLGSVETLGPIAESSYQLIKGEAAGIENAVLEFGSFLGGPNFGVRHRRLNVNSMLGTLKVP